MNGTDDLLFSCRQVRARKTRGLSGSAPALFLRPFALFLFVRISGILLLRLTESSLGGFAMKYLALVLVSCGVAALTVASGAARAFDIQGQNASLQDGSSPQFFSPVDEFFNPDSPKASSLAMPYNGKSDSFSDFTSDYGNMIPIPGPGIDKPTPAWAYR